MCLPSVGCGENWVSPYLSCRSRRKGLPPHAVFRSKSSVPALCDYANFLSNLWLLLSQSSHSLGCSKPEITMRFFSLAELLSTHVRRDLQFAKKTNFTDLQVRTDTPLSVCHIRQFATTARVTTFRFSQICIFGANLLHLALWKRACTLCLTCSVH